MESLYNLRLKKQYKRHFVKQKGLPKSCSACGFIDFICPISQITVITRWKINEHMNTSQNNFTKYNT